MRDEAFEQTLTSMQKTSPFIPYVIHFKDGGSFMVEHPEAVAYYKNVAVFITPTSASHRFDADSVTRINEYLAPEETPEPSWGSGPADNDNGDA